MTFALSIGVSTPSSATGIPSEPQSRPPISSGASGGSNPGGGSGYNPGGGGSNQNPGGGGYNPGSGGSGGYNPGNNSGGSGYNPGNGNRGAFVIAYRDHNYRGRSIRFDGDVVNLDNTGMNDEISSMQFRGLWQACTDAYFRGRCMVFRNNVRDLRDSGMNDRISSLRPVR